MLHFYEAALHAMKRKFCVVFEKDHPKTVDTVEKNDFSEKVKINHLYILRYCVILK
jgi:hypothetical protein